MDFTLEATLERSNGLAFSNSDQPKPSAVSSSTGLPESIMVRSFSTDRVVEGKDNSFWADKLNGR